MLALKLIILSVLACVFSVSAMPSHRMTNAERFAAGLPPVRPRKLFDATHVDTAARSRRSIAPNTQFTCSGGMFAACCTTSDGVSGDGASGCNVGFSGTGTCTSGEGVAACCPRPESDIACVVA